MVKPSIIGIHPEFKMTVSCLKCHSERVTIHDFLFEGIHILADCVCDDCKTVFFQTLPVAHDAISPIAFSKDGAVTTYDKESNNWLARPLLMAMTKGIKIQCEIDKKVYESPKANAILLNCIDDCFGHAYAKLWNAQFLLESYPEFSIIVLISRNFEWLVPKGVSEVWAVNGAMRDMGKYIANLHDYVRAEIHRFSEFYLSTGKVFHDTGKIDFELFLKTKRFDITHFAQASPRITFVLREDRYWHSNWIEEFLNRALIKLKWRNYFKSWFTMRQNALVMKAINIIKKQNPKIKFGITGFGKRRIFDEAVEDKRVEEMTDEIEKEWCDLYSRSHITIGVHGSNMLIPTALSAGFIEILPEHKIRHIGEDTISHYSGRYSILLGRHLDAFVSPELLAQHATHMLSFNGIYRLVES